MGGWTSSLTIVSSDLCVHFEKNSILGIVNTLLNSWQSKRRGELYHTKKCKNLIFDYPAMDGPGGRAT